MLDGHADRVWRSLPQTTDRCIHHCLAQLFQQVLVPCVGLHQLDRFLTADTAWRTLATAFILKEAQHVQRRLFGAVFGLLLWGRFRYDIVAFSALMVGGYSRFGVWKQIIGAIFLIIVVKAVETYGLRIARSDPQLWMVAYLQGVVGFVMIWGLLFWASRPYLFRRRAGEARAP